MANTLGLTARLFNAKLLLITKPCIGVYLDNSNAYIAKT